MGRSSSPPTGISPLAVPYLGLLAGLQLIDPSVANIALVNASANLAMEGPTLALAASVSTLAQAATVLVIAALTGLLLALSLLLLIVGGEQQLLHQQAR